MINLYPLIKTGHLFSVIIWFSGMIWMPQLFFQIISSKDPTHRTSLDNLASWMMKKIITPSMLATLILGITLVVTTPNWLSMGWLHAKLVLVLIMTGYHGFLSATRRRLANGEEILSVQQLKRIAWLPFIILAVIITLVILKPF